MEKGFKVFNPDWTCRDYQYEVGKTFEMEETPILCKVGFHYCTRLVDCFNYYDFNPNNKVAEIEALGDIVGEKKVKHCCTNKIKIVRELSWYEVLEMANTGVENTGYRNSGNYNSGYYNSGDCNSGDRNSGNRNSGYMNSGNHHSGAFNTEKNPTIKLFDKESNMTWEDFYYSDACNIVDACPQTYFDFISKSLMSEEEKEAHPEYKTLGGYTKIFEVTKKNKQKWWDELSEDKKETVKALPNFDSEKFCECVGIDHI